MFFICYSCFALFPKGNQKRPAAWMLYAKSFGINREVSYTQKTHLRWHKISKIFAYFTNLPYAYLLHYNPLLNTNRTRYLRPESYKKCPLKNLWDLQYISCGLYSILNTTQNSLKKFKKFISNCLISLNLDRFCCTKNSSTPDLYKITLVMYVLGLVVLHPKTVIRPLA